MEVKFKKKTNTHLVLKREDIVDTLSSTEFVMFCNLVERIEERRHTMLGKAVNPTYYVCNLDEPYADKVLEAIEKGENAKFNLAKEKAEEKKRAKLAKAKEEVIETITEVVEETAEKIEEVVEKLVEEPIEEPIEKTVEKVVEKPTKEVIEEKVEEVVEKQPIK